MESMKDPSEKIRVLETKLKSEGLSFETIAGFNKKCMEHETKINAFKDLLDVYTQLKHLVLKETERGWNWKAGLWEQLCLLKNLTPRAANLFPEEK